MNTHNEMAAKFHDKLQSILARKARHQCMFPGCELQAIHAHAMSKENVLRDIAEDGSLISPEPLRDDDEIYREIKFTKVGITKATTFKGFCLKHDGQFSSLDKYGLRTNGDVFLQLYRSFAGIVFEDQANRASAQHAGDNENFNYEHELSKTISATRALALAYDLIEGYTSVDEALPVDEHLTLTPFSAEAGMDARVVIRRIAFPCPVALRTRFQLSASTHDFDTFVFVVPSKQNPMVIIVCDPRDVNRWHRKAWTPIDTLNLIESSMMFDGQWWLAPSVVNKWSPEKFKLIESDYWHFLDRNYLDNYDVSLLDDVREKICSGLPSAQRDAELSKITNLPTREPAEFRRLRFTLKAERDKQLVSQKFPLDEIGKEK
ncbi:hypothetical protein [Pseudomonas deceptionensis]|uniref:Uncharacterized protein n=1 Tax=Pseudomonas deceptionensis TaxID=882211 RepID=A0A0J6GI48_PSEDM|nr:hypothetical protein [Pseudomonas deceptionensis]KMM82023.1 hypothetical protein TR67_08205 [Pseudomonas deceptionensis]SEE59434.1 hypothetical protein SAMN04489800_1375 [Pseudomonas deceptionensis]